MNQNLISAIDFQQLQQISQGDVEFEVEVLQVYVEDVLQRLEAVRIAAQKGDRQDIETHGHQIKGSSSNVGALQIKALAARLENEQQDHQSVLQLVDHITENIKLVELVIAEKMAVL